MKIQFNYIIILRNKGCDYGRNTFYYNISALPWVFKPKESDLLSSSRMKTSHNDWSVIKSHSFTGTNTKPPNELKRFNLNINKITNAQKKAWGEANLAKKKNGKQNWIWEM